MLGLERQNKFTKKFIGKNAFKKAIAKDLEGIWNNESISMPYKVEGKTFYYVNDGTWQQSKLMIKDCEKCPDRVLLDPNKFSEDGTISLASTSVSNAEYMAYSISDGGSDWKSWKIMKIADKSLLADSLLWTKFSSAVWENDNSGFYYLKYDEPDGEALLEVNEAPQLLFHALNTDQSKDRLIYKNSEKPRWSFGINVIKDTSYKILSIGEGTDERNRVYIQLETNGEFIPLIDELIGAYNLISSKDNILWFYTTENAPNGKVVKLEVKEDQSTEWSEVISETKNSISNVNVVNNSFVVIYLEDTLSLVNFYNLDGSFSHKLKGDFKGSIGGFGGNIDDTLAISLLLIL